MGLFSKIFANKINEEEQNKANLIIENRIDKEKKNIPVSPKEIFKGKNREEIINYFRSSSDVIDTILRDGNIKKCSEIISGLNYDDQEKKVLIDFINTNIWLLNFEFLNTISSQIEMFEKKLKSGDYFREDKEIYLKLIDRYKNLKSKDILFQIQNKDALPIVFIYENKKIKIVKINHGGQPFEEYEIFDIAFIYNFFEKNERIDLKTHVKNAEEMDEIKVRYELRNNNIVEYIDIHFRMLKEGCDGYDKKEFHFESVTSTIFLSHVKEFVFVSILLEAIITLINSNIEKSLSSINLDSSNNMIVSENACDKLIRKNQSKIIEIDKNYIHKFVKLSSYLSENRENIIKFYNTIDKNNIREVNLRIVILEELNHTYETLLFHSVNMVGALIEGDLITFYEIYEVFDRLGVFNSNWENEVSKHLTMISDNLNNLIYSIQTMERNLVGEIKNLTYVSQESYKELNNSVTRQLREIESSINTNNLLAGIQTYQLYKINKNTRGLR